MKIRDKSISHSIHKRKTERQREKDIEEEIQKIEKMDTEYMDINLLEKKKSELAEIRKIKMEGILLRAKARWALCGEKVTKYFCSLEKRHFTSRQMLKLVTEDGRTLSERNDMLEETRMYYQKLYDPKETQDIPPDYLSNLPKLNKDESDGLEEKNYERISVKSTEKYKQWQKPR